MQQGFGHMACTLHGPKHLREEAEDGVRKVLGFSGGPAVEPTRSPSRPSSDESNEDIIRAGEGGGRGGVGELVGWAKRARGARGAETR